MRVEQQARRDAGVVEVGVEGGARRGVQLGAPDRVERGEAARRLPLVVPEQLEPRLLCVRQGAVGQRQRCLGEQVAAVRRARAPGGSDRVSQLGDDLRVVGCRVGEHHRQVLGPARRERRLGGARRGREHPRPAAGKEGVESGERAARDGHLRGIPRHDGLPHGGVDVRGEEQRVRPQAAPHRVLASLLAPASQQQRLQLARGAGARRLRLSGRRRVRARSAAGRRRRRLREGGEQLARRCVAAAAVE
mmetsp:Transcript_19868/g.58874  ORF Transcript_19868/g.58874 Transcript_19868/m.58874 type:complete len:248 (-) Transcript_19868:21-764(-)